MIQKIIIVITIILLEEINYNINNQFKINNNVTFAEKT